jgi:hypothetical protein
MNDYNDGQIYGWNGGDCPVHLKSEVMVWYRGNTSSAGFPAKLHSWRHYEAASDIIAFQVTKPYVEPKVIWVSTTSSGRSISTYSPIAVKYVEVKE